MPSFSALAEEINQDMTRNRHLSDGVNVKCAEERQVEGHMQDELRMESATATMGHTHLLPRSIRV